MSEPGDAAPQFLAPLREICLGLPETYEEDAWVGIRWRVRKRTFAHVVTHEAWPPTYLVTAPLPGPVTTVTFRAPAGEVDAIANAGHPFYKAGWGRDVLGVILGNDTDWAEVTELLTESYCCLAPQKLVKLVNRPG
ncbi:MAG TPA: MmcQ/YjbR family DNA-binding protein [Micromonosporaceae bacterium]|nr:MmcQ/YjbR family DNA-binding protein [Micromonosporaceae bacterium]